MPTITAIVLARNDAARIGRALDSLRSCDEVLVIDASSEDRTRELARAHGATVKAAHPGARLHKYLPEARNDWILSILPTEALSEALEASLFLWKETDPGSAAGFLVGMREETETGWKIRAPELRLAHRLRAVWRGNLPAYDPNAPVLEGDLLRFSIP